MNSESEILIPPRTSKAFCDEEHGEFKIQGESNWHMRTRGPRSVYRRLVIACGCIVLLSAFFYLSRTLLGCRILPSLKQQEWQEHLVRREKLPLKYNGIYTKNSINSTLGFEKIIVLNLPHRSDKKDELTLMAAVQGLDLTFLNTRLFSDLKSSGLPWTKETRAGVIGVYRAHMDALQMVIESGWSSALILEDDSDWDINLTYALQQLHQPFATLINSYSTGSAKIKMSTNRDPWLTSEWDLVNFGPCIESRFEKGDREKENLDPSRPPFVAYEDRTIANSEDTSHQIRELLQFYNYSLPYRKDLKNRKEHDKVYHRLVTVSNRPVCTNAYAISRQGALRLLYQLSRELAMPIDLQIARLSKDSKLRSFSLTPSIFGQWKTKDAGLKNSDNELDRKGAVQKDDPSWNHNPSVGYSHDIKDSLRASLKDRFGGYVKDWGYSYLE